MKISNGKTGLSKIFKMLKLSCRLLKFHEKWHKAKFNRKHQIDIFHGNRAIRKNALVFQKFSKILFSHWKLESVLAHIRINITSNFYY